MLFTAKKTPAFFQQGHNKISLGGSQRSLNLTAVSFQRSANFTASTDHTLRLNSVKAPPQ